MQEDREVALRKYIEEVFSVAYSLTGDYSAAEKITSETITKAIPARNERELELAFVRLAAKKASRHNKRRSRKQKEPYLKAGNIRRFTILEAEWADEDLEIGGQPLVMPAENKPEALLAQPEQGESEEFFSRELHASMNSIHEALPKDGQPVWQAPSEEDMLLPLSVPIPARGPQAEPTETMGGKDAWQIAAQGVFAENDPLESNVSQQEAAMRTPARAGPPIRPHNLFGSQAEAADAIKRAAMVIAAANADSEAAKAWPIFRKAGAISLGASESGSSGGQTCEEGGKTAEAGTQEKPDDEKAARGSEASRGSALSCFEGLLDLARTSKEQLGASESSRLEPENPMEEAHGNLAAEGRQALDLQGKETMQEPEGSEGSSRAEAVSERKRRAKPQGHIKAAFAGLYGEAHDLTGGQPDYDLAAGGRKTASNMPKAAKESDSQKKPKRDRKKKITNDTKKG